MSEAPPAVVRLTVSDALNAARLHHRYAMATRSTILLVAVLAMGAALATYAAVAPSRDAAWIAAIAVLVMAAYLYGLFLFVRWVVLPWTVRRQFREQRSLKEELHVRWSERSYEVVGETMRSDLPWGDYVKWQENGELILLYISSRAYQILPKRILTAQQVAELRSHLQQAGVKRQRAFFG
ncbi:YcxB family protein [Methylobacterium brachythecii]|uniref:YcxB-like C-terminal domain-containing protein n=1 Tax=Methylobacterium brachythecii TaxID=1176177 RepID=A0A7W6AMB3_9HYPH|nr:YcxB family protein [Methylobacterium brachythecii]MBB3903839.1 hypothetical protein [Methylobacterium brachythecii]GLS44788.1 hypothetical protein GCM10007884_27770 [Methylobacterium brachythecii]